ncbi:MAG: hypothetical protein R3A80_07825 [Bdellovibrionota bacterium]
MRLFLILTLTITLTNFSRLNAAESSISKCSDAKVHGACSGMVQTAVNVCKDNQRGKDITASRLEDAKSEKLTTSTNFDKLTNKYKRLEDSARSDAQNQKACYDAATALKKDCVSYCDDNDKNGSSCNKSLESLDEIRNFCKKNEEGAEEIAEMAAQDAAAFANTRVDTGGGGTTGGTSSAPVVDTSLVTPPTATPNLGYTDSNLINDGKNLSAEDGASGEGSPGNTASGSGAGGSAAGAGAGAGGSGVGSVADGSSDSALSRTGSGGKKLGTGLTNAGAGADSRNGSSGSASVTSGKSEGSPSYMFWGVPSQKKKPPLTLLTKPAPANEKTKVVKKEKAVNKAPASTEQNSSVETSTGKIE